MVEIPCPGQGQPDHWTHPIRGEGRSRRGVRGTARTGRRRS